MYPSWRNVSRREYYDKNPVQFMWSRAKNRAKKKNWDFNLEQKDIVLPEFCPILGIKLEHGTRLNRGAGPSIDRIDSNKGYTKDNIQIISWRANDLKKNATFEEIEKLYFYLKGIN